MASMAGSKQRELLKGRVKRLLKAQEDMGQVGEPALRSCVSAVEVFVRDLARRIRAQEDGAAVATLTPIELKKAVLGTPDFGFLHDKVSQIDESAVKYHKAQQRGQKRTASTKEKPSGAKKPRANEAKVVKAPQTSVSKDASKNTAPVTESSAGKQTLKANIEEDDNYDESDSE